MPDVNMQGLVSLIQSYLELFRRAVEQARTDMGFENGPRLLLSNEQVLLRLVHHCEQAEEFAQLVDATNQVFSSSEAYGTRTVNVTRSHVKNFFRLSGAYQDLFASTDAADCRDLPARYLGAFECGERKTTWIAPLVYVGFDNESFSCVDFAIRRFSKPELSSLLRTQSKQIFYRECYVDPARLVDYWFLCVEESVPGSVGVHLFEHADAFEGEVPPIPLKYPLAVERVLRLLTLYDWGTWGSRAARDGVPRFREDEAPFAPEIPFVFQCCDSPLESPDFSPDLANLPDRGYDSHTGELLSVYPGSVLGLDKPETLQFQLSMAYYTAMLRKVQRNEWAFIETALGFLLRGFLSHGADQVLWNIAAIEAVFGEKGDGGLVQLLTSRVSRVLGHNEQERKDISKRFKNLYAFRSDLVHGNARLLQSTLYKGQIAESREFARQVVLWAISYAFNVFNVLMSSGSPILPREALLQVLEIDDQIRSDVALVLKGLPQGFPSVDEWRTPVPTNRRSDGLSAELMAEGRAAFGFEDDSSNPRHRS